MFIPTAYHQIACGSCCWISAVTWPWWQSTGRHLDHLGSHWCVEYTYCNWKFVEYCWTCHLSVGNALFWISLEPDQQASLDCGSEVGHLFLALVGFWGLDPFRGQLWLGHAIQFIQDSKLDGHHYKKNGCHSKVLGGHEIFTVLPELEWKFERLLEQISFFVEVVRSFGITLAGCNCSRCNQWQTKPYIQARSFFAPLSTPQRSAYGILRLILDW